MFTSLIDSFISIIPGFGDAATDRSEDKLKEQKLFEEVGIFGKSKVDISGIESALADEKISKQDIANLVKAQGHDLSEEDIGLLTAIAGKNLVESTIKGENAAKGGFIVNRPTYLPSSGVVVGEHPTWKGGAAKGSAGQSEMVVPFKLVRTGADGTITYTADNITSINMDCSTPLTPMPIPQSPDSANILIKVEGNTTTFNIGWKIINKD